jgi:hypothetical protein
MKIISSMGRTCINNDIMDTQIQIPDTNTIFIKTSDNIVFEIDKTKWCENCNYIHGLYSRHNDTYKILNVDFDSELFKKLSTFVENPYISNNWKDNEKTAQKYGIDIQPSIYMWLQNSQMYKEIEYFHDSKIINILCNDEYIIIRDISGNIYKYGGNKILYNSKYSSDMVLHPTLPYLAMTNDDRTTLVIINLITDKVLTRQLNFTVCYKIVKPSLIWQNDVLFVKNLEFSGEYFPFFIANDKIEIENGKELLPKPNVKSHIIIEKHNDSLFIWNTDANTHFVLVDVGEKSIFNFSNKFLIYINYNHVTIFEVNDDV